MHMNILEHIDALLEIERQNLQNSSELDLPQSLNSSNCEPNR